MTTSVRSLLPDYPIVEILNYGHLNIDDVRSARAEGIPLSLQFDCWSILFDLEGTIHAPTAAEIVTLTEELLAFPLPDNLRQAVVRPTDLVAAVWADLFVTAASNRGLVARGFRERQHAIDWLISPAD